MTTKLQQLKRRAGGHLILSTLLIAIFLISAAATADAQSVTIKRTFFTGWKYSTDGETYHKVGAGADDLMTVMEDHRVCVAALRSYRAHSIAAKMTGLTSAALITFPLISGAITGEWSEGLTPMMIVGLGFGALSLALDASGSGSLKQAVRIYNRYGGRYQAHLRPDLFTQPPRTMTMSLKMNF